MCILHAASLLKLMVVSIVTLSTGTANRGLAFFSVQLITKKQAAATTERHIKLFFTILMGQSYKKLS
ncbi:hypothetical protein PI172_2370 [Prevotella intermedia]|uniref:Uncharacterized protein n=1 Tax=Prevotella intermedia TaxID=28131 RepID=A0AAD1F899_PREIN|nr:hypothetical protein PI172_2370 [Prevotella intermedia]